MIYSAYWNFIRIDTLLEKPSIGLSVRDEPDLILIIYLLAQIMIIINFR